LYLLVERTARAACIVRGGEQIRAALGIAPIGLQTPLGEVKLFTVIATLGAPLDVTAANLAIETFLPMDPTSAARLAELSAARSA